MRLLAYLLSFFVFVATAIADDDTPSITLGGTKDTKNSFDGRFLDLIYSEAFFRLGYALVYKGFPAKRASVFSDAGEVDGEITRVYSYGDKHPNMIRVDEPHFVAKFCAYATDKSIHLEGWQSLKGTDYRVVYRRGVKQAESMLPGIVKAENLYESTEVMQGLEMLVHGHTDLFIGVQSIVDSYLYSEKKLQETSIERVGVMESITAHLYLHKKNKHLVDKVSEVLKDMKEEGLFLEYRERALQQMVN